MKENLPIIRGDCFPKVLCDKILQGILLHQSIYTFTNQYKTNVQ